MSIDDALIASVGRGTSAPTLRFYGWIPGCLSLGYGQPVSDADRLALEAHGWDLVRRPTGGRAILHIDELTYAIIAPRDHPVMKGGLLESYRRLSQGLITGLQSLGIDPDPPSPETHPERGHDNPVCFEVPSAYEITSGGKKLLGSAQLRRKDGILQHGSLPLTGDLSRICLSLRYEDPQARRTAREHVLARATTVEALVDRAVGWDEAAMAIQNGLASALGWQMRHGILTDTEVELAKQLEKKRYRNPAWNERL
jgi:lipoate-protein ligase A